MTILADEIERQAADNCRLKEENADILEKNRVLELKVKRHDTEVLKVSARLHESRETIKFLKAQRERVLEFLGANAAKAELELAVKRLKEKVSTLSGERYALDKALKEANEADAEEPA